MPSCHTTETRLPDLAPVLRLHGRVCAGLGIGSGFTRLDWVVEFFWCRFGFDPHPGTFNLRMSGDGWRFARERLLGLPGIAIPPPPGCCAAKCFRVRLDGRPSGVVVFPEVADYPADKFEVIAPFNVRAVLGAREGDLLEVEVETGV